MVPMTLIMLMYFVAILLALGKFHSYYLHGFAGPKFHWVVGLAAFAAIFVTDVLHEFQMESEATRWWCFGVAAGMLVLSALLAFGLPTPRKRVHYGPIQPARSLMAPKPKGRRRISDPTPPAAQAPASASNKGAA